MNQSPQNTGQFSKEEFEKLFRDYFKPLVAFAKKYTTDIDAAKEIVHDVFVNLWNKRAQIDIQKSVKSYIYTSAYNRSLNYLRDQKKFDFNQSVESSLENNFSWSFEENMDALELEEKINKTIDDLPEKCRQVFMLSRFEGLKYHEIADKLGISVKTVEGQISKALAVLKTNLKEYLFLFLIFLIK